MLSEIRKKNVYVRKALLPLPYLATEDLIEKFLNPFVPNAPFLYPLKTCFQGVEKGCIGNK